MITITLYTNTSDKNAVNKTLTGGTAVQGEFRDATDILNPVIVLDTTDVLLGVNYCYIPDFGRYYFITDIQKTRTGLTTVYCRVDVLMSFASEIKAQTATLARQENKWNLYLNDGASFRTYVNPYVTVKEFPSGFTGQSIALIVAGGGNVQQNNGGGS